MADLHWNPNFPRHGLGENLTRVSHKTFFVTDLQKSVDFYTDIMNLKLVSMEEGKSAILDVKNLALELKVGKPIFFSAENLIVGHVSIDVPDTKLAFDYLIQNMIPFEMNVSVPKGIGKAESEGGSSDNTLAQAFVRDPDGYYLEICNCHLLHDFVFGLSDGEFLDGYEERIKCPNIFFEVSLLKMWEDEAIEKLIGLSSSSDDTVKPLSLDKQPKKANAKILGNFIKRRAIYGDICQSFSEDQLDQILREAGNSAPNAILLMRARIKSGDATKVYQPPAYYVGKVDESTKYKPNVLIAGVSEKGRDMDIPAELSTGVKKLRESFYAKREKEVEDEIEFEISSVNHIAFIVKDVGKSIPFYSELLGLQQVRRPNFDRHGAWFTGGNIEIHLILGNSLAPERSAKGSETNCTWLDVEDFNAAKAKLTELAAEFESRGHGDYVQLEISVDSDGNDQVTCRDPDGYVFGICAKQ